MLDEAVKAMQADPTLRLQIEGHTCNIGTAEYNLALGDRRASSVRDYLASRGIPANRLSTTRRTWPTMAVSVHGTRSTRSSFWMLATASFS